MNVLLIRHAIAEDRARFARTGRPDSERPLTSHGQKKFKRSLKGFHRAVKRIDVMATSPYRRARQTCGLVKSAYPKVRVSTLAGLAHGGNDAAVIAWLRRQKSSAVVALVGHEPDLGRLTARLLGHPGAPVTYKKGGVGFIAFDGGVAAGKGTLRWLLTPALLKRLR